MRRARARRVAVGPACEDRLRHRRRRRGPVRGASARGALAAPRARGNGTGRGPARGGRARLVVSLGPQSSSQDLVGPADGVDGAPLAPRCGGPLGPRRVAHLRGPGHRPAKGPARPRSGVELDHAQAPVVGERALQRPHVLPCVGGAPRVGGAAGFCAPRVQGCVPLPPLARGGAPGRGCGLRRPGAVRALARGLPRHNWQEWPNTVFRRASPLSGLAREPGLDKETAHDRVH